MDIETKTVEAKTIFKLNHAKKTLLVLGGSLGSRRINQLIEKELEFFQMQNIQIIWQCGKLYYQQYKIYNNMKPSNSLNREINRFSSC